MEENSPHPPLNQIDQPDAAPQADTKPEIKTSETPQKPSEISGYKIPAIRTYEHDIEEAMAQRKISSASISIAEADARRKQAPENAPVPTEPEKNEAAGIVSHVYTPPAKSGGGKKGRGFLKLLISILLIALGLSGGYYLYTISPYGKEALAPEPALVPAAANTPMIQSIVTPDSQKVIDITGQNAQAIFSAIQQDKNAPGMLGIVFKETEASSTGATIVPASEFIEKLGMNPPDALVTSLGNSWMFGIDGGAPFMILTTNFFQNTFAGMLSWEPTMPEDLSNLFGFTIGVQGTYQDRILDNKNIREFVDATGAPIYLYGFTDNQTLVIARNEATFSDIVNRIEKESYVR